MFRGIIVTCGLALALLHAVSASAQEQPDPIDSVSHQERDLSITFGVGVTPIEADEAISIAGLDHEGPCSFEMDLTASRSKELAESGETTLTFPASCPTVKVTYTKVVKQLNSDAEGVWDGTLRDEKLVVEEFLILDGDTYRRDPGAPHGQYFPVPDGGVFGSHTPSSQRGEGPSGTERSILGGLAGSVGLILFGGVIWRWTATRRRT